MTQAELDLWVIKNNWSAKRRAWLEEQLRDYFIYPSTRALARRWAEVSNDARRAGRRIRTADAWIAATALHLGIPLVTHNATDYAGVPDLIIITEQNA